MAPANALFTWAQATLRLPARGRPAPPQPKNLELPCPTRIVAEVFLTLASMALSYSDQLVAEVIRLFPRFLEDPIDREISKGNAAVAVIEPDGTVRGHLFGEDRAKARWCFGIANRKVIQVWSTGYATGRFEELVYSGQLDDTPFGVNRPDFIGWQGGVPLLTSEGKLIAAAFSGIRGINDIAIIEAAAAAVPGLRVKRD